MTQNDIFRWSYNIKTLAKMNDGNNGGTTYWCCSTIGIIDGDYLVDTFWGSSNNKVFSKSAISEKLNLEFIANKDDLVSADPLDRAYYLDADCVDLNHPNSTVGNFYLRKGAKKCLLKIERVIKRKRKELHNSIKYELSQIEMLSEDLKNISEETRVGAVADLFLGDSSYIDDEVDNL